MWSGSRVSTSQSEIAVTKHQLRGLLGCTTVWLCASKPTGSYGEAKYSPTDFKPHNTRIYSHSRSVTFKRTSRGKNKDKMHNEHDDSTVIYNTLMQISTPIIDSDASVITHNFPSLKERTKTLSFFSVTSSWQSGEMTLL